MFGRYIKHCLFPSSQMCILRYLGSSWEFVESLVLTNADTQFDDRMGLFSPHSSCTKQYKQQYKYYCRFYSALPLQAFNSAQCLLGFELLTCLSSKSRHALHRLYSGCGQDVENNEMVGRHSGRMEKFKHGMRFM